MEVLLVLIVVVIGIFFYAKKVGFDYYDNKSNEKAKEESKEHKQNTFYTPKQVFDTLGVEIVEQRENGGYIIAYQG